MDFYFPDSQDQVDPNFNFEAEEHLPFHVRQRDDRYAHELHDRPPYRGILISKTAIDGYHGAGRYTAAQRHRLYRLGARQFFRLPSGTRILGDCGGFSYVMEERPPVSVEEVIDFYEATGVDEGVSVDHVILGYRPEASGPPDDEWVARQALTLELAATFLAEHRRRGARFEPVGVAQGYSPTSYAASVERLQEIGYRRIALGGMVPLKIDQIVSCLEAIQRVRRAGTSLHLLGISRVEHFATFRALGVQSLDSTSPFRQAFKDDRDNYYAPDRTYVALRIPPSDGNQRLQRRIQAGQLDQAVIRRAETCALAAVRAYDEDSGTMGDALLALRRYERLHDARQRDHTEDYRAILEARPWKHCPCAICQRWGVEVAIFRGTERNKRRGFHNLWVFNQNVQRAIAGWSDLELEPEAVNG